MVRVRDWKCRHTFVDKTPKYIFGPQRIPQINFDDQYTGSSSRRRREVASQPEPETSQIVEQQRKQLQEEAKQDIIPITDQEADPKAIHPFLNQTTDPVLCQVDLETIADNFEQNLVEEPS